MPNLFSMLSERLYWIFLIAGLTIFCLLDWLLLLPFQRDLAINLLASAIFTIFTIVFLTWAFRIREVNAWKRVENYIRRKIADRLQFVTRELHLCFLVPQGESDFRKKAKDTFKGEDLWREMLEIRIGIYSKTSAEIQSFYAEYFAKKSTVKLLASSPFLESVRKQDADTLLQWVRVLSECARASNITAYHVSHEMQQ